MTRPDENLREFFDVARAAESAERWPLLAQFWKSMGGEALAPRPAATKLYAPPTIPAEPKPAARTKAHTGAVSRPESTEQPVDANADSQGSTPSLEELFGRLR